MAISDEERRMFEELQRDFVKDDPDFVRRMSGSFHPARLALLGTLIFFAGVIMLLTGVATNNILLGIAGFITMMYAAIKGIPRVRKIGNVPMNGDDDTDVKT